MRSVWGALFLLSCVALHAQLRLPSILASGMVLQQNDSVALWGWAGPAQEVTIAPGWTNKTFTTVTSNYSTWKVKLNTPVAGGPYKIKISTENSSIELIDVLVGEVWVCSGQSNMEWNYYQGLQDIRNELPTSYNPKIRFFNIPKAASDHQQEDVNANWEVCDSVSLKSFSAVAYFFGKKLHSELNVPIGLINASWGGTPAEVWTPAEIVQENNILAEAASKLITRKWWPSRPGSAFNSMIYPITQYGITGAIWYQGESNTGTASTYELLFTSMIGAWRNVWQKEFPFYYVQIAPYAYDNKNVAALLQEAQTKSSAYPKTGMVVITDLVDNINDIHPTNKHDVGYRLASYALAETYKRPITSYRSPQFKYATAHKDKLELHFDFAPNGFQVRGRTINGFFISGNDNNWHPAEAKIENDKIIVSSKHIAKPTHVRYGFGNTLIGNVFSKEGLPLRPFRTDNFPVDTSPVK